MRLGTALCFLILLGAACGSEPGNQSQSSGGTGGSAAGGTGGRGGAGGGGGSSIPTPDAAAGGSMGAGGSAAGGAGGAPIGTGGAGGINADASTDGTASADMATPDVPSSSASLDECFLGIRPFVTPHQIATKRSSDGKYRARLALERVPGGAGTSGTIAWRMVRAGIQTPTETLCFKDEASLTAGYKGSHHNCMDALTITSGGTTYKFQPPDTDNRPMNLRVSSKLTITASGAPIEIMLTTEKCDGTCTSGGPCQ